MDYLSRNVSENLKKIRKAKGMSLEFETDQPHVYRNQGTEKVCCVCFFLDYTRIILKRDFKYKKQVVE